MDPNLLNQQPPNQTLDQNATPPATPPPEENQTQPPAQAQTPSYPFPREQDGIYVPDPPEQPTDDAQQDQPRDEKGRFVPRNEIERLAMQDGWNPNREDSKSAEDWIKGYAEERKKFHDRLDTQSEMIANLTKLVKGNIDQQGQRESQDQLAALQAKRREARESGEWDEVDRLDEEIDKVKDASRQTPPQQQNPFNEDRASIFNQWIQNNKWYEADPNLRLIADRIYDQNADSMPLSEILRKVDAEVNRYLPQQPPPSTQQEQQQPPQQQAYRPQQPTAPSVLRGRTPQNRNLVNFAELDQYTQNMIRNVVDAGAFADKGKTLEEKCQAYAEELQRSGAL